MWCQFREVVDATEVGVIKGGREDVEVTVSVEDDIDASAGAVRNVELGVDNVEMVLLLLCWRHT